MRKKSTFILSCLFMVIGILGVRAQAPTSAQNFDPNSVESSYILYANATNSIGTGWNWGSGGAFLGETTVGTNKVHGLTLPAGPWSDAVVYQINPWPGLAASTVSTFSRIRFDVYSPINLPEGVVGQFLLRDFNELIDKEVNILASTTFGSLQAEVWKTFEAPVSVTDIYPANRIVFQKGNEVSAITLYIDNIVLFNPKMPGAPAPSLTNPLSMYPGVGTWTGGFDATPADNNICRNVPLAGGAKSFTPTSALTLNGQNALHLNVFAKTLPSSFQVSLNGGTFVNVPTNSLTVSTWGSLHIPLSQFGSLTTINSIAFQGNGDVWIDDIIFYYEDANLGPVAQVASTQFNSIKAAYDHIVSSNMPGNVTIQVIENSKEPNQITIDLATAPFTNLTICPTGAARTVTYTGTTGSLFAISNGSSKSVTIDGRLNGSSSGTPNSLILKMPWTKGSGTYTEGATVSVNNVPGGVNLRNCTFEGVAADNRPRSTVKVTGTSANINIQNNYFKDCLLLDAKFANLNAPTVEEVETASVVFVDGANGLGGGIVINGNDFFESTHSYFRSAIVRSYIFVDGSPCGIDNQIKITNNKIGGNAPNLAGTLKIGASTNSADATAGDLLAINVASNWPDEGSVDADSNSRYILIEGNGIANIEIYNRAAGVYSDSDRNNKIYTSSNYIGGFAGINVGDGLTLVRNNTVHNIKLTSKPATSTDQRLFFKGIYSYLSGGTSRAIIEDNQLYNFDIDYTEGDSDYNSLIGGILTIIDNWGEGKVVSTIRNNRILMGHKGTHATSMYTDIHGISARVQPKGHVDNETTVDIYNNIVVLDECKYTGTLRNISPIDVVNSADTEKGIINLYNNIIAVIPNSQTAFDGVTAWVTGINYVSRNDAHGIINIFHNTVYLKEYGGFGANGSNPNAAAMNMEYGDGSHQTGNLRLWNNNFVNTLTNDLSSVYCSTSTSSTRSPRTVVLDYNNYYVPAAGNMFKACNVGYEPSYTYVKTFDNWKFSNLLPNWGGKTSEHEFHSRFLDPCFSSALTLSTFNSQVPVTTMGTTSNIDGLKSLLTPKRFIAGKKTDLTELGLKTIATAAGSHTISTTTMADVTNMDFDASSNAAVVRRVNLPTMGAINTSFDNYWNGAVFARGVIPNTSNANPWERDIVFAESANADYSIVPNMSIHDFYNDTQHNLTVGANTLTITGYVGQVGTGRIYATDPSSVVVYNGIDGHSTGDGKLSAAAQHIFAETFVGNAIQNIRLNNQSQYFVLLHPATSTPTHTLSVGRDFAIENPDATTISYPSTPAWLPEGVHPGGLNCTWYNTTLRFNTASATTNHPVESSMTTPYAYRPYAGQRIPRHAIYNDEVYNLTINSDKVITYHDYLYVKNDLAINANRSFEVAADKYVRVFGTTSNNGGNAGLVIQSRELDAAETVLNAYLFPKLPRPNATFIYNPSATGQSAVPATVEMYSMATEVTAVNSHEGTEYTSAWQYFTPAVVGATASSFTSKGGWMYEYYPQGNNLGGTGDGMYDDGSPFWIVPTTLDVKKGYAITSATPQKYSMTGMLYKDPFNIPATDMKYYIFNPTNDPAIDKNWPDDAYSRDETKGSYLFGNPYTHSVAITDITIPNNFDGSFYLYNTGSFVDWESDGRDQNSDDFVSSDAGKYTVVPKNLAGTGSLPKTISSMQPFTVKFDETQGLFTHASSQADVALSFNYGLTANNEEGKIDQMQRAPQREKCVLEMLFKNGDYRDYLLLVGNEGTGKGFDNGWDARKQLNAMQALSLFTIEKEDDQSTAYYQVSTMEDLDQTDIAILIGDNENTVPNLNSKYELLFRTKNLNQHYSQLYLEDLLTGELVDLLANEDGEEFSYEFTSNAQPGEIQKRFRISSSLSDVTDIPTDFATQTSKVYSYGKTIVIEHPAEAGSIQVYDVAGKCVLTSNLTADNQTRLDTYLQSGVYLVKVVAGGQAINTRIILK